MPANIPLRLEEYFYIEQFVKANVDYNSDLEVEVNHSVSTSVKILENNVAFCWVTLELDESTSKNSPYTYKFVVFGIFKSIVETPQPSREQLIRDMGAPLLIGAIRERLHHLTATGPYRGRYLDFISSQDIK